MVADKVIDIADKLGLIEAVKRKLIKQPDPAADKLVIALEEISKMHSAIDEEIGDYLGLWFDSANTQAPRGRQALLDLEGDKVRATVSKADGSCKTIWNIYTRYLNPWFGRLLNKREQEMMHDLFSEFREIDSDMVDATDELAAWLGPKAGETLSKLDSNDWQGANELILSARKEILPVRLKLSDTVNKLYKLQAEFIEMSGALGSK